jgi:hypothetical protein
MDEQCIFKSKYGDQCDDRQPCSKSAGSSRIISIIQASQTYKDSLFTELETQFSTDPDLSVFYHKNCVSRYTSKTNLAKYLKADTDEEAGPSTKRLRRSSSVFDFMHHCLYCGQLCELNKNERHPERWRPAYLCRSTHSEHSGEPYKVYLLDKCDSRADSWANDVRHRVQGALSDLHAVEARYHRDCMSRFFTNKYLSQHDHLEQATEAIIDIGLDHTLKEMKADKHRIWNSLELFHEYSSNSGRTLSRRRLLEELRQHFGSELLVLSAPGFASIVTFTENTAKTLKLVKDDEEDDISRSIAKVSKQVVRECKAVEHDKSSYNKHIDKHIASQSVSDTLQDLLTAISPKLETSLPALLIGNIITSIVTNRATDLQVALGILMRDSKELLTHMYDYRVTCSYDEILRFKKSAALAAAHDLTEQGISDAQQGLVQVTSDNFDTDISTPNGKASTHSLAMIIMQPSTHYEDVQGPDTIRRIKKEEVCQPIPDDNDSFVVYYGQKKPEMPSIPTASLSSELQVMMDVSRKRAAGNDFAFFNDVVTRVGCPEFNGYNTRLCREQGHTLKPKTNIVYLPLIDMPPADPSTMMAAMKKAQQLSHKVGQEYVVFTADLQLYRIALHVQWENPIQLGNIHLRLGGMHLLMSYCGSIGTLMADTGIVEILSPVFGGVLKMLSGKKFPQNVRALRMLVEELLRSIFTNHQLECMADLTDILDDLASQSRTTKLWVECLIKPMFLVLQFIRAEREADWPLHLATVKDMIPLFFAAGHVHYARYALYYLRSMHGLPKNVSDQFMKGQHTMHHNSGLFNGIWSDMAIETTFMRYGKGKSGIVGITVKPETLKTWAYSLHTCHSVIRDLSEMRERDHSQSQTQHKEETPGRIKGDLKDRQGLRDKLELCTDPLDPKHPKGLLNIVTGQILTHQSINVDTAAAIGHTQMQSFEESWPAGFHATIPKLVTTMSLSRQHIKVGDTNVFDTEVIYARAMALQRSSRDLDTDTLMCHELAPVPTAMFDQQGNMRDAKTKSNLKNALKVDVSRRLAEQDVQTTFLDGCAILWVVPWPTSGTVQDYLDLFRKYLCTHLTTSDVYLVFDR